MTEIVENSLLYSLKDSLKIENSSPPKTNRVIMTTPNINEGRFEIPKACMLMIKDVQILGALNKIIVKGTYNKNVFP